MSKPTSLQEQLNKRFDKMLKETETDPKLKKDVFDTISTIENIANVLELFTGKLAETEASFLDDIFLDIT